MIEYPYSAFSPCGNYTLFLHGSCGEGERAPLCASAMRRIHAEQAAFVDIPARSLVMAAGEFCVNASRAFGALLDWRSGPHSDGNGSRHYSATVSGIPVELYVRGACPRWQALVEFDASGIECRRLSGGLLLVDLPGISHLLVRTDSFPPGSEMPEAARQFAAGFRLGDRQAFGVVWWREHCGEFEIRPFVSVPEAGTAMLENSCGSASLALALTGGFSSLTPIVQPCGESLSAALAGNKALVMGAVTLVSAGSIWLEYQRGNSA